MRILLSILLLAACGSPPSPAEPKNAVVAPAHAQKPESTPQQSDAAKATVLKYAFEAYPQWAVTHPDKDCPASLAELDEFMNRSDTKDPWGHDYKMMCGATLPADAKGFAVLCLGPDGQEATADDIKSW